MKSQQSHLHQAEASAALTRNRQTALCTELYTCNLVHIIQQKYLHRPVLSIEHDSIQHHLLGMYTVDSLVQPAQEIFSVPSATVWVSTFSRVLNDSGARGNTSWHLLDLFCPPPSLWKAGHGFVQDWFNGYATGVAPRLGPKYIFSIQYWSCHLKKKMLKNTGA